MKINERIKKLEQVVSGSNHQNWHTIFVKPGENEFEVVRAYQEANTIMPGDGVWVIQFVEADPNRFEKELENETA